MKSRWQMASILLCLCPIELTTSSFDKLFPVLILTSRKFYCPKFFFFFSFFHVRNLTMLVSSISNLQFLSRGEWRLWILFNNLLKYLMKAIHAFIRSEYLAPVKIVSHNENRNDSANRVVYFSSSFHIQRCYFFPSIV